MRARNSAPTNMTITSGQPQGRRPSRPTTSPDCAGNEAGVGAYRAKHRPDVEQRLIGGRQVDEEPAQLVAVNGRVGGGHALVVLDEIEPALGQRRGEEPGDTFPLGVGGADPADPDSSTHRA